MLKDNLSSLYITFIHCVALEADGHVVFESATFYCKIQRACHLQQEIIIDCIKISRESNTWDRKTDNHRLSQRYPENMGQGDAIIAYMYHMI